MNDLKKQMILSIILVFSFFPLFTMIVQAEETHDVSTINQSNASIIITTPNQKENDVGEDHHTEKIDLTGKPEGRLNQKKTVGRLPNTGEHSALVGLIVGNTLLLVLLVFSLKKRREQKNFKKLNCITSRKDT
ncbi:LPXTG cell wall anchor domain-containing protein [Enterococcus sp. AZ126]|uniref:LPXTG cell wall anchor domain-containing protein n=1 Tax=Enterococcus sp. AZ126 TaxID=2774635 RepID=UPI003F231F6A